ncbi:ATP-binding protein [Roseimaritima sediminicola]|uniref:ATP-binding protein n=1 Tax=Roseimaritima sediminicola TaxID=2662066 RepID=UPI0036F1FDCB
MIGDVPSATAILDRFLDHSEVMQVTGRSYRMGNPGKTSNSTKASTGSATEEV